MEAPITSSTDILFQPFDIGPMTLPNRIVMAPMTRSFSPENVPGDNVVDYYRRRAEGHVGLIISEGVIPNTITATGTPNVPTIATEKAKAGWKKVIDAVHAAGGKMGLQLWHEGPMRRPNQSNHPETPSWSPSGFRMPGKPLWEPMTDEEIEIAITEFVDAAVANKEIGFDCVEFHGAHSYLLDSFFWSKSNLREDKWGGSWENRTRVATEIISRTRKIVGPDYPLIIRLSQWKQQDFDEVAAPTPQELEKWLTPLVDAGIDCFHCSQRRFWEPTFEGSDLNFAGWARKITGKPAISVGSVGLNAEFTAAYSEDSVAAPASLDKLTAMMDRGDFELIAVGRALLQDPDWVKKVQEGRNDELMTFDRDALGTLY